MFFVILASSLIKSLFAEVIMVKWIAISVHQVLIFVKQSVSSLMQKATFPLVFPYDKVFFTELLRTTKLGIDESVKFLILFFLDPFLDEYQLAFS